MNYKIGSFNMKNWTAYAGSETRKDFEKIAQIIREEELDVVGLQEILSEGKGVSDFVKSELYGWEVYPDTNPNRMRESNNPDKMAEIKDRRGEIYAYLWNKRKFKILEKSGKNKVFKPSNILESGVRVRGIDRSTFVRAPYYIRLQPLYGGFFELRLINVHIYWGGNSKSHIKIRKNEFDALTQCVYPAISQNRDGQNRVAYTVAMGDYNLNIFNPNIKTNAQDCYLTEIYSYTEGNKNIQVHTVQDQLTTLNALNDGFANNYDHFTYSPELTGFVNVSFEAIDAVNKYCGGDFSYYEKHISDHLPIVMTVEI